MDCEVIVVGGGIVGLWTAYHLKKQGVKTILLEQFPYPHTRGSSHGQSRITRMSYTDEVFSRYMPEATRRWKELEKETGRKLYLNMGLVSFFNMNTKKKEFVSMVQNLKKLSVKHEVIAGKDVEDRFPGLVGEADYTAVYEVEAGLLKADNCLLALQELFKSRGGQIHDGEPVLSLNPINDSRIEVKTSIKTYVCKSVVLTCGAYINDILSTVNLKIPVRPIRASVCYWKDTTGYKYNLSNNFPAVVLYHDSSYFYLMPSYEYPGLVKICPHSGPTIDPNKRDKLTQENEDFIKTSIDDLKRLIKTMLPDIDASSPAITESCQFADTPDNKEIVDFHPQHKNIIIASGFSGAGFKTSPSVGRILAAMATGRQPPYAMGAFSIERFRNLSKL